MARSLCSLIAARCRCFAADLLPLMKLPPGKVVLVLQPHHDDHTTDYGMGGLIARFVDEGYDVYYVRASNDEKDGSAKPAENDIINHRESVAATKVLGIKEVISLNWRNDYSGPIPLNELRTQLIFLIRKYKPDIVVGHDPWEHYQKNPDHRNVGRAMAEAYWLAGYSNVNPEQLKLGVVPHQASYLIGKARSGLGPGPYVQRRSGVKRGAGSSKRDRIPDTPKRLRSSEHGARLTGNAGERESVHSGIRGHGRSAGRRANGGVVHGMDFPALRQAGGCAIRRGLLFHG